MLIDAPPSERAFLGALLAADESLDPGAYGLTPEMFATPAYSMVFKHMLRANTSDPVLVEDSLLSQGEREDLRLLTEEGDALVGEQVLLHLKSEAGSRESLANYSENIRYESLRRKLDRDLTRASTLLYKEGLGAALTYIAEKMESIRAQESSDGIDVGDGIEAMLGRVEEHRASYTRWPWKPWRERSSGYLPQHYITVFGYSGQGKTVALTQMAEDACRQGKRVAYCPLEMSEEQMLRRMVQRCGVPMDMYGRDEDKDSILSRRIKQMKEWKLTFHECYTLEDVLAVGEREKPDLLVLDHLHRLPESDDVVSLTHACRQLKNLARRRDIVVLQGAQLRKPSESPGSDLLPVPRPSMLKGAAAIEQESDVLLGVYRPLTGDRVHGISMSHNTKMMIFKDRFGEMGWEFEAWFDDKKLIFEEYDSGQ